MTTINLKKVFFTCQEKFCSMNGAPVGRLLDEGMRQERAMPRLRPKARCRLVNAMIDRISPMV